MNETFLPAGKEISVETFAQRLIALDTLRHAIVDLWDFAQRMNEHPTGWTAKDVLRLEEIRQLVEAERPLLPTSRETALQFKAFLTGMQNTPPSHPVPLISGVGFRTRYPAHLPPTATSIFAPIPEGNTYEGAEVSPREKSNDEQTATERASSKARTRSDSSALVPRSQSTAPAPAILPVVTSAPPNTVAPAAAAADESVSTGRSGNAPRKTAAKIRSRGAAGRRQRGKKRKASRRNTKR